MLRAACCPAPPRRYTSKVTLQCPTAVHSRVDDSTLFSHLTNKWEFRCGRWLRGGQRVGWCKGQLCGQLAVGAEGSCGRRSGRGGGACAS